jgi:hypothetical protein
MNKTQKILTGSAIGVAGAALIGVGIFVPAISGIIKPVLNDMGIESMSDGLRDFALCKFRNLISSSSNKNTPNENIQKLVFRSINQALESVEIAYQKKNNDKKETNHQFEILRKTLKNHKDDLSKQFDDNFVLDKDENLAIKNFLLEKLKEKGCSEEFVDFFEQNFSKQLQHCFTKGLNNYQDARKEFDQLCITEIRQNIKDIAKEIGSVKEDLSNLKFDNSGLSKEDIAEFKKLVDLLNDRNRVTVIINDSIALTLKSIEEKANEILKTTAKIDLNVEQLLLLAKASERREKRLTILFSVVIAFVFCGGAIVAYFALNQSFNTTILVKDWKGDILKHTENIYLQFGYEKSLINADGEAIFTKIPSKFNNETVKITLIPPEYEPYYLLDSVVIISKKAVAEIRVSLKGLERLQGIVVDEKGLGIADANVFVADISSKTNENGFFNVDIPLKKQKRTQEVEITKNAYLPYRNIEMPMLGDNKCRIILVKE